MNLSPKTARFLARLVEAELERLRVDLADNIDDEDAVSDISNDMSFAAAVLRDIGECINKAGAVK